MVNNLFATTDFARGNRGRRSTGGTAAAERSLFSAVVEQVQTNLASCVQTPSSMRVLSSYYTHIEPAIDGRPFCVALADCTILYHLQMARVPKTDVDLYAQLVTDVMQQIDAEMMTTHPFMTFVVHDRIFGLPSSTCTKAHSVVLLPPHLFVAFDHLITTLVLHNSVPEEWVGQWHRQLQVFAQAASSMVAQRSMALLVRTATHVMHDEQVRELHAVLRAKKNTMNIDSILTCYERLKRIAPDVERGTPQHRALAIHCSEIFLKFRSPIRRDYVEQYLYPALCSEDMRPAVYFPSTREHLTRRLLRQCVPNMSTTNAFYMCMCAMIHREMANEVNGAHEFLRLMRTQMPHAAYFIGTLATDTNMSLTTFSKTVMVLTRASAFAMTGRSASGDEVAQALDNNPMDVYNVLFTLREVVRHCSCITTRRGEDMLAAAKRAIPEKTIEALGKLSTQSFDGKCEVVLEPSLLCAELGMVVHDLNIDEGIDASLEYLTEAAGVCPHCAGPKSAILICPVQGVPHLDSATAARRLLSTLAECAGSKVLEKKFIALFRDPTQQTSLALHHLAFHILSNAGQHRLGLFKAIEPYVRTTLITILSADRSSLEYGPSGMSVVKANIMILHVKLAVLMNSVIDASYVKSILKVFSEMQLRSNHDALVLWFLCNFLLRNGRGNVDLMAVDPLECNYADGFPACAPANHVAADNAQLLLQLLDRALSCSAEMKKLTGCTVCRMVQDFCVQTPNIVSSLLGPCGFVAVSLQPLHDLAFPVGSESNFWTFVLRQMRSSAPARTALMTSLARCISMRFRNHNPAEAVAVEGGEATGHVFSVLFYESMRRNAVLARSVLHMMSAWLKQKRHLPGKFTCLVYCCIQLAATVQLRHEYTDHMEAAAEPLQERRLFDDAVHHAVDVLAQQLDRVDKLLPEVAHNAPFCFLLKKMHLRARMLISEVRQQAMPHTDFDNELADALQATMDDGNSGAVYRSGSAAGSVMPSMDEISIGDLQNADDDDVFSSIGNDELAEWDAEKHRESEDDEGEAYDDPDDDDGYQQTSSIRPAGEHNAHSLNNSNKKATSTTSSGTGVKSILMQRSAASSIGPSVSLRPATTSVVSSQQHVGPLHHLHNFPSRSASAAKSTQTANDVATNTSFSDGSSHAAMHAQKGTNQPPPAGQPHGSQLEATKVYVEGTTDAGHDAAAVGGSSAKRGGGQYFFKNTPSATAANEENTQRAAAVPMHTQHHRSKSGGASSGASSNFLRRAQEADDDNVRHEAAPMTLHRGGPGGRMPQRSQGNFVVPSDVALAVLMQAQNADSLIHDFGNNARRTAQLFMEEQAAMFPAGNFASSNGYHAPHHTYVPAQQHTVASVTMEPHVNNYAEPHALRMPQPQTTVMSHLTMQPVEPPPRSIEWERDGAGDENMQSRQQPKRRRLEDGIPPLPSLQGQYPLDVAERLGRLQNSLPASSVRGGGNEENYGGYQLVTPHASRSIPTALVEQQADSTLRELGIAGHNAVNMGGSSAKRRFTSQQFDGAENESRWYTLSSAPMPSYASDHRYNMEMM